MSSYIVTLGSIKLSVTHGTGLRGDTGSRVSGGVTQSVNGTVGIAVSTSRTGMGGITGLGTGRRGYYAAVRVRRAQSRNFFLSNRLVITSGAMASFGQTCFGTSGCFISIDHDIVPQGSLLYVGRVVAT